MHDTSVQDIIIPESPESVYPAIRTITISGGFMDIFFNKLNSFYSDYGKGRTMVLSTSEKDRVTSRMMSVVQIGGLFWFQTDIHFRKYRQLHANRNVALCTDNMQIEGTCDEMGHPLQNPSFCKVFQECFKDSYDAYSALKNERLFAVKPLYIERWVYREGIPYIETFDLHTQQYGFEKYCGA